MLLRTNARRWAAGLAAVLLLAGTGLARDDKPAAKEEKPAVDPKDVRVGPPPELAGLRQAVEDAAKAGENVAEIRKQLEALEKALAGKAWVKPKPVEEPPPPPAPPAAANPFGRGGMPQGRMVQPLIIGRGGVDADIAQLQAELLRLEAEVLRGLQADPLLGRGGLPGGRATRLLADGRLGVRIEQVPAALADQLDLPAGRGLLVTEVRAGSPADKAGVKVNDVLMEFAGRPVTNDAGAFIAAVDAAPKDRKVDVTVFRKGKRETFKGVDLPEAPRRGADFQPLRPEVPRRADVLPVPPVALNLAVPQLRVGEALAVAENGSVSVRITDGAFTLTAEADGVKYTIEGTTAGKVAPTKITIVNGEKKTEAGSLEKVPAEYRKQVEKFLGGVRATR